MFSLQLLRRSALSACALLLCGCSALDNRIVCTITGDEAHFVSKYLRIGVSARIAEQDAALLCRQLLPLGQRKQE